jgi:3-hydroxyacyl-[acyl-carrier-protein] dehydratase
VTARGPLDAAGIQRLLPHRPPMLLLDEVRAAVPGESVIAAKAVTAAEPCYQGLAAGADDAYPPTLLIESWCQAAALLALLDDPGPAPPGGRVPLFGGIAGLRLGRPVRPGDLLVHRARLSRLFPDAAVLTGGTECAGESVLDVERIVVAFRAVGSLAGSLAGSPAGAAGPAC